MMAAILVPVGGIDRCAQRHLKLLGNRARNDEKDVFFVKCSLVMSHGDNRRTRFAYITSDSTQSRHSAMDWSPFTISASQ